MRIVKGIIGGALFGAALFFVPFILMRVLFFLLIIGFIFRLFRGRGRWGGGPFGGWGGRRPFAFADYVRGMSDDQYSRFKDAFKEEHLWERYRRNHSNETRSSNPYKQNP